MRVKKLLICRIKYFLQLGRVHLFFTIFCIILSTSNVIDHRVQGYIADEYYIICVRPSVAILFLGDNYDFSICLYFVFLSWVLSSIVILVFRGDCIPSFYLHIFTLHSKSFVIWAMSHIHHDSLYNISSLSGVLIRVIYKIRKWTPSTPRKIFLQLPTIWKHSLPKIYIHMLHQFKKE